MNRILCLVTSLVLLQTISFGQSPILDGHIRVPSTNSFYSKGRYVNDILPPQGAKKRVNGKLTKVYPKDYKNTTTSIIENIENPSGTLVVDGNVDAEDFQALMEDPSKITFSENHAEIPLARKGTIYRISVTNESTHHSLSDPLVLNDFNLFITDCQHSTSEVPGAVVLRHNDIINSCQFLAFKSRTNLYRPYFQFRLNLSCVFLPEYIKFLCFDAKDTAQENPADQYTR